MRTQLFIIALIAISTVAATSFQEKLAEKEFAQEVESMKAKENMGSVIVSMAELETDKGRFVALFNAIDKLSAFLVHDRAVENQSFKLATAQFHRDVSRLTKQRNIAQRLYKADIARLNTRLYPARRGLIKLIGRLEKSLKDLIKNLAKLRRNRKHEIAIFKKRSADFVASINACKQAIPILNGLINGQSFAEVDAEVFTQVSGNLKSSLGKLQYGSLYTVFVESMVTSLKMKSFVNQDGLKAVIKQIQNLQTRLEKGLVALNNDEALNKKNFEKAQASLQQAIRHVKALIKLNKARLVRLNNTISAVKKHRDAQIKVYKQKVNDLIVVNKQYVDRTNDHKRFIHEINDEEATIAAAIRILHKGGVSRNA